MNKKNLKQDDQKQKKRKEILAFSNNLIKTTNGSNKLRLARVMKSIVTKNQEIHRLQTYYKEFKDSVINYHTNYIEKTKIEERAFLSALQISNIDGPPLDHIIEQQIKDFKENELSHANTSINAFSPISSSYKHKNITLSTLKRNALNDNSVSSLRSQDSSPSSSIIFPNSPLYSSVSMTNRQNRVNLNHFLLKNAVTGRTCSVCCRNIAKKHMHKCQECGLYVHIDCRNRDTYRLCIIVPKTGLKITTKRSIMLKELCGGSNRPLVPNILLAAMNHVQTFGLLIADVYSLVDGSAGGDREVRELCGKMMDGKLKSMVRSDVRVVSGVVMTILRGLKEPLLDVRVVNRLEGVKGQENDAEVVDALKDMGLEARDTMVYVLLHLQIISKSAACHLDSERLARLFSPVLADSSELRTIKVIKMLIERSYKFYDQHFLNGNVFFIGHFNKERIGDQK